MIYGGGLTSDTNYEAPLNKALEVFGGLTRESARHMVLITDGSPNRGNFDAAYLQGITNKIKTEQKAVTSVVGIGFTENDFKNNLAPHASDASLRFQIKSTENIAGAVKDTMLDIYEQIYLWAENVCVNDYINPEFEVNRESLIAQYPGAAVTVVEVDGEACEKVFIPIGEIKGTQSVTIKIPIVLKEEHRNDAQNTQKPTNKKLETTYTEPETKQPETLVNPNPYLPLPTPQPPANARGSLTVSKAVTGGGNPAELFRFSLNLILPGEHYQSFGVLQALKADPDSLVYQYYNRPNSASQLDCLGQNFGQKITRTLKELIPSLENEDFTWTINRVKNFGTPVSYSYQYYYSDDDISAKQVGDRVTVYQYDTAVPNEFSVGTAKIQEKTLEGKLFNYLDIGSFQKAESMTPKTFSGTLVSPDPSRDGKTYTVTPGKNLELWLMHGESLRFDGLPAGTSYALSERAVSGYTATVNGAQKNAVSGTVAAAGTTAAFLNDLPNDKSGSLQIQKTVTGSGDRNKEWNFTLTLQGDALADGAAYPYSGDRIGSLQNGGAVSLRSGESVTITGLPEGTTYTVTEAEANKNGYVTSAVGAAGTIAAGGTATAAFTNYKSGSTDDGSDDGSDDEISISVKKVWEGSDSHPDSATVQLYRDGKAYGSPVTLNAENNWRYVWGNLSGAYAYTVDEVSMHPNYTKTISGSERSGFVMTNRYHPLKSNPDTGAHTDLPGAWAGALLSVTAIWLLLKKKKSA